MNWTIFIFQYFNSHWALYTFNEIEFNSATPGMNTLVHRVKSRPPSRLVFKQSDLILVLKKKIFSGVSLLKRAAPLPSGAD